MEESWNKSSDKLIFLSRQNVDANAPTTQAIPKGAGCELQFPAVRDILEIHFPIISCIRNS
jgi:hypothetical protein